MPMSREAVPGPVPIPPYMASNRPLVGRARELATLRSALAAALAGHGGLVLVGGAAGIGKTALAEALIAEARGQGGQTLVGRCYDRTETPPYGPFLDLLRDYDLSGDLPPAPFSPWRGTEPAGNQTAFYARALTFFRDLSGHRPLVLLLDDFQWADQASLDLLRVLARALPPWPILVIVTYRTDELDRFHPFAILLPLLERESSAVHLALHPLGGDAIAVLVEARYPLPSAVATRLTSYLLARSEGNALFVAQLLRALEEQRILRCDEEGWSLGNVDDLGLPVPLRRVIETRLARLDEATRALFEVAAVLGQAVPLRLWARVAGVETATIEDAMVTAGATGLLAASADGAGGRFVHALVREAVYAGIFPPRRRSLHRVAGEVLATIPATDPDTTAYHFAQAGDPRAASWLLRAADRAERVYALRTAAERLLAALALPGEARVTEGERGWLLLRLARLHRYGDHQRGLAAVEEAERSAREQEDRLLAALVSFQRGYLLCQHGPSRQDVDQLAAGVAALDALSPDEWTRGRTLVQLPDLPDPQAARGILALFLAVTGRYTEVGPLLEPIIGPVPTSGALRAADAPAYQAWAIVQGTLGAITPARAGLCPRPRRI